MVRVNRPIALVPLRNQARLALDPLPILGVENARRLGDADHASRTFRAAAHIP